MSVVAPLAPDVLGLILSQLHVIRVTAEAVLEPANEIQHRLMEWLGRAIERVAGREASPAICGVLERAAFAGARPTNWPWLSRVPSIRPAS